MTGRVLALPAGGGGEARRFCLSVIAEVYGHGHDPDWHADLDGLAEGGPANPYDPARGGGFFAAIGDEGDILATGGFHALALRPALAGRLAPRFGDGAHVVQVSRVYVRADSRGLGLGAALHRAIRAGAEARGYRILYLHAAAQEPGALAFWRRQGYAAFGTLDYLTADGRRERAVDCERPVA